MAWHSFICKFYTVIHCTFGRNPGGNSFLNMESYFRRRPSFFGCISFGRSGLIFWINLWLLTFCNRKTSKSSVWPFLRSREWNFSTINQRSMNCSQSVGVQVVWTLQSKIFWLHINIGGYATVPGHLEQHSIVTVSYRRTISTIILSNLYSRVDNNFHRLFGYPFVLVRSLFWDCIHPTDVYFWVQIQWKVR